MSALMQAQAWISLRAKQRFSMIKIISRSATTASVPPKGKKVTENKYSKTVQLPQTTFEQRANAVRKEPEIQNWWKENQTYERLSENNAGDKFVLHDGPPYANGDLHMGHALNKILKDFINRYNLLLGKKSRYVPGWDCHGLPIELKVLQSISAKERETLTPIQLRKKAAQYAVDTMRSQREAFKRYGVWGDWDKPYLTLQPEYEAAQIKVFSDMVQRGHIYRGKKPVHWSPSSRTALAEAELEYPENHISKSIYVGFKAVSFSDSLSHKVSANESVRIVVWTTTPWTIPANLAVAVNGNLKYAIISHPSILSGAKLVVAEDLVGSFASKLGIEGNDIVTHGLLTGLELTGTKYQHPFYDRVSEVIVGGDYITTDSGTGLVHTAPGHGQEDYLTGLKYGLPLLSPVDDLGKFTSEAGDRFMGKDVLGDGNLEAIKALEESGTLLKVEAYNHKYPYDWRTKKPTIFRATEQWFASVSTFKTAALNAIDSVQWIPLAGRNRIAAMTDSRGDWCISRQRSWGVPIPVFYRKTDNEPLMTAETLKYVEEIFRVYGSDAWWEKDVVELLPTHLRDVADEYYKGTDTMDVWFDSGTSWAGVAQGRPELKFPVDLYLEGSDQSRGWFQSSLLTSVASQGIAPYKTVLTHGFVLDEKGFKMSKSLGNVIDPRTVIEGGPNQKEAPAYGADTLRMWVSGVDYSGDVCVGTTIMKQSSDSYRKIRNTVRFLLGSLSDFDPMVNSVPYGDLPEVDKNMLGALTALVKESESAYNDYQFYRINQLVGQFTAIDLSSFYLDISKDRLYISSADSFRRRSCQTVINIVTRQLLTILAPILPHLAEEAWQSLPYRKDSHSIFENGWISKEEIYPAHDEEHWALLRQIRSDANKCIELARQSKLVGASMEASVYIHTSDPSLKAKLSAMKGDQRFLAQPQTTNSIDDLRFILMASQVHVVDSEDDIYQRCGEFVVRSSDSESRMTIGAQRAIGSKCARCWYYSESVGDDHDHPEICARCASVVKGDGYTV